MISLCRRLRNRTARAFFSRSDYFSGGASGGSVEGGSFFCTTKAASSDATELAKIRGFFRECTA